MISLVSCFTLIQDMKVHEVHEGILLILHGFSRHTLGALTLFGVSPDIATFLMSDKVWAGRRKMDSSPFT